MASVFVNAGDLFITAEALVGCEAEVKALRAKIAANAKAAAGEVAAPAKAAAAAPKVTVTVKPSGKAT